MPLPAEPALHSYLGQLDAVPSVQRASLESDGSGSSSRDSSSGSVMRDVLIVPIRGCVVFPGETVPLKLPRRYAAEIFQSAPSSSSTGGTAHFVGILNCGKKSISTYGTLCEVKARSSTASPGGRSVGSIYNSSYHDDGSDNIDVSMTALGTFRFRVIVIRTSGGLTRASAELFCQENASDGAPARVNGSFRASSFPWVFERLNPTLLAQQAWKLFYQSAYSSSRGGALADWGLASEGKGGALLAFEADPLGFSYYLCANIPVSDADRISLLECPNVTTRLLRAISLMLQGIGKALLCCSGCSQRLALRSSIFKVDGAFGIVGNYVNAHGVVHQTVTVKEVVLPERIVRTGEYSAEDCWFPGYKWQIISCSRCYRHLGWHYIPDVSPLEQGEPCTSFVTLQFVHFNELCAFTLAAFHRMTARGGVSEGFFGFRRDCLCEMQRSGDDGDGEDDERSDDSIANSSIHDIDDR